MSTAGSSVREDKATSGAHTLVLAPQVLFPGARSQRPVMGRLRALLVVLCKAGAACRQEATWFNIKASQSGIIPREAQQDIGPCQGPHSGTFSR